MAQTKSPDDANEADGNSDEIAREIIAPMVERVAGSNIHSKPPLPHHLNDPSSGGGDGSNTKSSHNIVFHPDYPEKMFHFESSDSEGSHENDTAVANKASSNDRDLPIPKRTMANGATDGGKSSADSKDKNARKTSSSNGSGSKSNGNSNGSSSEANGSRSGTKKASSSSLTREQRKERKRKLEDPNCFPKRFEVQVQARVRTGQDLTSAYLTDLPEGSVVTVEEIVDRRARISRPLCGWLSVTSKFGARIILPTNSKYSKIGGKVLFKKAINGQQQMQNGQYPQSGKVIDFNDERNLYKVRYDDGTSQWIDIENPSVQFVSQHRSVKVPKSLDGTAPTFTLQTSQKFFNTFFCKDYPQFQAQSSSTTRHMDISPVAGQAHGAYRFPPGGNPNAPRGQYPPNYPRNSPHGQYPHGQAPGPYPNGQYPAGYPQGQDPRHGPQANGPSRSHPGGHGLMPYPNHHAPPGPLPTRPPPQPPSDEVPPGPKSEDFVKKVKEIERRIIQHLHQRGYDESHPDYHRYLQKAKELAIQKAGKERERTAQQRPRPPGPGPAAAGPPGQRFQGQTAEDYKKYMQYRTEQQQQHDKNEQVRKQKMAEAVQKRHEAMIEKAKREGKSPPKQNSAVKGLIVLRGLPGSGKTTLAKKLSQRSKHAQICTEDRYHWSGKEDGVGEYKFQPQLVFLAREWCTKEIREAIQQNVNLIILDNHNARISMYEDHIQFAVEHGYRFRIIEFVASASLIDKYRARSYKKFPREVYVKLLKLWEHDPRTELINPTFGEAAPGPKTEPTKDSAQSQQQQQVNNQQARPHQQHPQHPPQQQQAQQAQQQQQAQQKKENDEDSNQQQKAANQ